MPVVKYLLLSVMLLLGVNVKGQQTVSLFYEKVFIHTDRDAYTSGETIWFKAYLTNAQNNTPINYSHNLYVELIAPGLNITTRNVVRLDNGLGNGDFKLPDTLSAGKYRIRAYTNWMRNFGEQFIFEKNITIINTDKSTPIVAVIAKPVKRLKSKRLTSTKVDTLPTGPIVRFFPEGGSMVDDVRSTIAVRAEDEWGRGIAVSGQVFASSGRAVAKFTCDSLGMATFSLRPDESQQYHAEVTIQNQPMQFKLSNVLHKGFVLGVNTISDAIVAEVNCNNFMLSTAGGSDMVLTVTHAGHVYHKQLVHIKSKTSLVQIPDTYLPEGIAGVTLFDEFGKPLTERLVYVHHTGNTKAVVSTDKPVYTPKEKVTVKIKLSDTTKTHLSLAVVDAALSPVHPENILSYLTLKSELKGTIEHPERYFDTTNVDRFKQLDMLLLTQGWRNYIWKEIANVPPKITYDVEQGITVTGKVRGVFTKKPLPGINVTMFAPKADKAKLFSSVTDSAGRFTMDGALLYGYQYVNFTSRAGDGIKADGTSKGKSGGWVQVDSLYLDVLPVKPTEIEVSPVANNIANFLTDREKTRKKFSFTGVNELKTVQIKAQTSALLPIEQAVTLKEHKEYESLLNYLLYNIPGSFLGEGHLPNLPDAIIRVLKWGRFPLGDPFCAPYTINIRGFYTDKSKIDYRTITQEDYIGLPMDRILKVTIYRRNYVCGIYYNVVVMLRPGALEVKDTFDNTMADIKGYNKATEFFAPRYQTPNDKPDYRTTIHWEPNITTDAHGEAIVTYYNADPKNKVRLIMQGITDKGVPIVAGGGYEVK